MGAMSIPLGLCFTTSAVEVILTSKERLKTEEDEMTSINIHLYDALKRGITNLRLYSFLAMWSDG